MEAVACPLLQKADMIFEQQLTFSIGAKDMNRGKGFMVGFVFRRMIEFIIWINFALCLIAYPFALFSNNGVSIKGLSQRPSFQTASFGFGLLLTDQNLWREDVSVFLRPFAGACMFFLLACFLRLFCTTFSANNLQRTDNENNAQWINVLPKIVLNLVSVPLVVYIIWS